jgi:glyoxylate reductase
MKPKALVTRRLLPEAHKLLDTHLEIETGAVGRDLSREELLDKVHDKQGLLSLLVDRIDREVLDAAPGLRIVANCAAGYNNIDVVYAAEKGILVTNTPGVLTETTADLTWALILATARMLPQADRFVRQGRFTGWALDLFLGREVSGKCLGILGMGRIGKAVALRAQAFRMNTLYYDPHPLDASQEKSLNVRSVSLERVLEDADILTLHTSLTEETRHLIGEQELARMKPSAILINVSRGPVVDEKALVSALKTRKIWGAGLDVYEREPEVESGLLDLDNVVCLPHIGSASHETRLAMAETAARNLIAGLSGERPLNPVY